MSNLSDATIGKFFTRKAFRARLRACMLAPYWDGLVSWMTQRGHPQRETYHTIRHGLRLAEFAAQEEGIADPALLSEPLAARYEATRAGYRRTQREIRLCLRRLLTFLREQGIVPAAQLPAVQPCPPVSTEYLRHLAEHRGIGAKRIALHRLHVVPFLQALDLSEEGDCAGAVDAAVVSAFVTTHAERLSRHQRKSMCAA